MPWMPAGSPPQMPSTSGLMGNGLWTCSPLGELLLRFLAAERVHSTLQTCSGAIAVRRAVAPSASEQRPDMPWIVETHSLLGESCLSDGSRMAVADLLRVLVGATFGGHVHTVN